MLPPPVRLPKRGEVVSANPEYAEFLATGHIRFADSGSDEGAWGQAVAAAAAVPRRISNEVSLSSLA